MNVALPALVILLGILPGIAFFNGYFAGRFDRRSAGVSGVEELALYVLFAIPLSGASLYSCRQLGIEFNFEVATRLIAGSLSDQAVVTVAQIMRRDALPTLVVYLGILVSSFVLGSIARRTVWAFRLDTKSSLLRLRHGWFYTLQGRLPGNPRVVLAYVDVLTQHPDGSRLYRGLVVDFEIAANGNLHSLAIRDAHRGKGRGSEFQWVPVPSNQLTLMGSTIHSINVTYVGVEDEPPIGLRDRLVVRAHLLFRSFFFQEP